VEFTEKKSLVQEGNAMLVKTRKSLLRTLVIVTLVVLCGGVNIANAGNLGTGSYYLLVSDIYGSNALKSGMYALYWLYEESNANATSYGYDAYVNMYYASSYAYSACLYCYYGYSSLGSSNAYYAYIYAYYDYLYASSAWPYMYYCYLGTDYARNAIDDAYYAQLYNGYAAYYAGLASYNGAY